jgi:hypothetical protein
VKAEINSHEEWKSKYLRVTVLILVAARPNTKISSSSAKVKGEGKVVFVLPLSTTP